MIKIFVDSGSSIKMNEREKYDVEILPLKIILGSEEYLDGINLSMETFYHALIEDKIFPKTSLPSLGEAEERIRACLDDGHEVLIITISSAISGTYNTFTKLFEGESRVRVVDSKTAVGGIRILVTEANKYRDKSLDYVYEKLLSLIQRLRVIAIPDTLEYLHRGGRLSKTAWLFGNVIQLKPLISLDSTDGGVKVLNKARGKRKAIESLVNYLEEYNCDPEYPIVPSYTYNSANLDMLISMTPDKYKSQMIEYDHLDPAIACHWGPGAFGYIFVSKQ
ncbi:MAG: DegV family protein [Clostridia bacterium]|nr:DegV family protein [Clostridia bacterium]